ncbi:hypothetical protein SS50377_20883 [Spironucleus salmonicida]|uniref:Uncharacterized protein n=1 Tax=Spironucleus salmonicida TaxID=348837 RepID=V6LS00_9EUKA|nr:hypothetical protein SS50377_20883 [Spironucleus salmonicida]|eukprot:EST43559.1 Hypothetical protein SS50377_16597 [Spironucleus salmonicida]
MAAEVFINERSSGKLLSHIIINPILSTYPQLTSTFITSFFSAVQQKSFMPLTFLQFETFSLSFDQNSKIQLIVASKLSSAHYLRAFARQAVLLSTVLTNSSILELEWNRIHFRILQQLVQEAKRLQFIRGSGLFLREKVDEKGEFMENFRGSAEKVRIEFKERPNGQFWLGQDMAVRCDNVILVVQFDKNAVFEQIGDGEEIQRGRFGIVGFPGSDDICAEVSQIAQSCRECVEMIV